MADKPVLRQPDAGTTNVWTVVGGASVHAYQAREPFQSVVLIDVGVGQKLAITPHQARAIAEVLPAAAAVADGDEEADRG